MSSILARAALVCHPDTPCDALAALGMQIELTDDHGWEIGFVAMGRIADLRLPEAAPGIHTDELWRTTCFELFVAEDDDAYAEYNFSPSGAFAAYHFDHYRTGMRPFDIPAPHILQAADAERLSLSVRLTEDALVWDRSGAIGASAVIQEANGTLSYWALAHPPGWPDFHHRDCFALRLPPVDRA
ncbi:MULTISPECIES: DOMON-like domain-containing protein [unclassified Sphingobium]|uniref:DOMON-like domain-containing protein n=1 Tax=unclassified Sphingobium TaxID=2611147 RepID=UPI002225A307|nr:MULTISPECIES: DOMON-like domain-containing protein [unclassified Sphingobium]MCW2382055.1 hypothetical protein [Sphingobium sp. B2D3B]MCW2397765.1 hypothetical protein [Sphingobium sp. B2D3C]